MLTWQFRRTTGGYATSSAGSSRRAFPLPGRSLGLAWDETRGNARVSVTLSIEVAKGRLRGPGVPSGRQALCLSSAESQVCLLGSFGEQQVALRGE